MLGITCQLQLSPPVPPKSAKSTPCHRAVLIGVQRIASVGSHHSFVSPRETLVSGGAMFAVMLDCTFTPRKPGPTSSFGMKRQNRNPSHALCFIVIVPETQ